MVIYDDSEIGALIEMEKFAVLKRPGLPPLRAKRGHVEARADYKGQGGFQFRVVLRRSSGNPMAFSAILMVRGPKSSRWFRLRRYNGNNHAHRNLIEQSRFRDFHIHSATERYQLAGQREDAYAEPTDRFSDYEGAVRCLVHDAGLPSAASEPVDQLGLPLEDMQ